MGWLASIGVALLTAVVSLFGAGLVASLAVDWYQISAFEGGAGFFVLGMAILGLLGGFVIGLVASRVVAGRPHAGFLKALAVSFGSVCVILALVAGLARMLADVPPEIDGAPLFLQVELRWPRSGTPPPTALDGAGYVRLGASSGSYVRKQEGGPLFTDDVRQEDGRWIAPGAVEIFTSRGQRVLQIGIGQAELAAFIVPLPGHPRTQHRQWSEWLPHPRDGAPELADQFTYRFRVLRRGEALRIDTIGPFEVRTLVSAFYNVAHSERFAGDSRFEVLYKGTLVPGFDQAESVAVLAAAKTTLLVHAAQADGVSTCHLLYDADRTLGMDSVGLCATPIDAHPLTSDPVRFRAARSRDLVPGWVDTTTFDSPGLFQLGQTILDTRDLTFTHFVYPSGHSPIGGMPPLGISPDERSMVWFALTGSQEDPAIVATDFRTSRSYALRIDPTRMRSNANEKLDPAWIAHHFEWVRGASGSDTLVEKPGFIPLPYRGDVTLGKLGDYQSYAVRPGGEPLRAAIVGLLVSELKGERLPDRRNGYEQCVRVDGKILAVSRVESPPYVLVSMESGEGDPNYMKRIADRLDAALASGRYDAHFGVPSRPDTQPR